MLYTNNDLGNFAKDPAVVEIGGYYWLYHSIIENKKLGIGIARSEDGENFVRIASLPITQECESNGIGAPGAIIIDGKVHLFYQTYGNRELDAICHAVSEDGLNFIKDASNPIFAPREPYADMPEWSCGRAIDADVCLFDNKLILYFATRDKKFKRQIVGAAWAASGSDYSRGSFTLCPDLTLEPILPWEIDCIEAPATLTLDGKVYMFYAGAYNCAPQQIGCAVSDDGFNFKRLYIEKPLLSNGAPGEWNSSESGHPYIYKANDGRVWLYYQGSSDMGKTWYLSRREVRFINGMPEII
jgi:predicted GH43/DUF377 family glycosyl hydrolase